MVYHGLHSRRKVCLWLPEVAVQVRYSKWKDKVVGISMFVSRQYLDEMVITKLFDVV